MHLYGLIIGIATVIGLNYFEKNNTTIPKSKINIFTIGLLISLLVGARAYEIVSNWNYYKINVWQIINIPNGGLGIYGALIAGSIFIYLYSLFYHLSFIILLDSITPILPLAQSIGRFGNYVNGEIPIWWLESLLSFILFLVIRARAQRYSPTALYLIGYGIIRLITEYYRTDTWYLNGLNMPNIISIIFIIIGTNLLKYPVRKSGSIVPDSYRETPGFHPGSKIK